jgi:hypothetical protein
MRADIDYARAMERHSKLATKMMRSMRNKHRQAGLPDPAPEDLNWYYDYAVPFGGGDIHVSLAASLGRRMQYQQITLPGVGMPRSQLPPEVAAAMKPKTLDPKRIAHHCSFDLITPNDGTQTCLALGGYRDADGTTNILYVTEAMAREHEHPLPILATVSGTCAAWGGGLRRLAQERFDACEEGGIFYYDRRSFTKLTSAEIQELVQDKVLRDPLAQTAARRL